jgi:hypothetical protein
MSPEQQLVFVCSACAAPDARPREPESVREGERCLEPLLKSEARPGWAASAEVEGNRECRNSTEGCCQRVSKRAYERLRSGAICSATAYS